jgi:hypothetical protein
MPGITFYDFYFKLVVVVEQMSNGGKTCFSEQEQPLSVCKSMCSTGLSCCPPDGDNTGERSWSVDKCEFVRKLSTKF